MSSKLNPEVYFPIYKSIEEEVVNLSSSIYFSDDQISVYSLNIAELIIRCVVEIESIAKDIYRLNNNTEPESPGVCFKWMEDKWKISEKKLIISSTNFYFDKMKIVFPFKYQNGTEDDYYSNYNAIKHDRVKNLKKANISTLIRSVGALFILNLFYRNDRILLNKDCYGSNLDKSFGSKIFTIEVLPCSDIVILSSEENIISENCIFRIKRQEGQYAFRMTYLDDLGEMNSKSIVNGKFEFQEFAKARVGKYLEVEEFFNYVSLPTCDSIELFKERYFEKFRINEIKTIQGYKMESSFFAELNV